MAFQFDLTISLGLIFTIVAAIVGWVRMQNRRLETRIDAAGERLDRHDGRISSAEQTLQSLPAKTDLHRVELALANIGGDMREMRASMAGQQMIMSRLESVVTRQEDHLMRGAK